jgi:hypothetical protein
MLYYRSWRSSWWRTTIRHFLDEGAIECLEAAEEDRRMSFEFQTLFDILYDMSVFNKRKERKRENHMCLSGIWQRGGYALSRRQ